MSQPTKPAWNASVRTRASTVTSQIAHSGSSMSVKRKPVPVVDIAETSSSSTSNTRTVAGSSSSTSRTPRSRVSSMVSTASAKSSVSGHTQASTGNVKIPRPRVMSTSTSSTSLRSTLSASPKSNSGSHRSSSPKSTNKSVMSARSTSPGNLPASNSRLLPSTTSPSVTRSARSASNIHADTNLPLQPKRLSSVSAVSTNSNYSQKSFTENERSLSSSPEMSTKGIGHRNRPVDDPGGGRSLSDDGNEKDGDQKFDRSTVKSGYGSVFGFGGKRRSPDGSPTSGTFSFAPSSHVSQSSVSSVQTLPAPSYTNDPDPSTPTASSANSPPNIVFHSPKTSPPPHTNSEPLRMTSSSSSPSASATASPSSLFSRPLPNLDRVSSVPQVTPPVRPPRARPPPVSKSQSSPSVMPVSSPSTSPSSASRTIAASTQTSAVGPSNPSRSTTLPTTGVTPSHPSSLDSRSRSGSKSSHSPSQSPATSPRPPNSSLPAASITTSPSRKRTVSSATQIPSTATTRARSKSTVTSGGTVAATTTRATTDATGGTRGRMTDSKRSATKVGTQNESKKNVQDKSGKAEEDLKSRDRAGSSATLKGTRPPSSKATAGANSSRNVPSVPPTVASSREKSPSMTSSPALDSSRLTTQTPRSPPSSRTIADASPSITTSRSFKSNITPGFSSSTPISSVPSHSNSPPHSHHPRPHGHTHVNGPPSPGMTVSLKQLLSKPAPPGYTSAGSASESEGYQSRGAISAYEKDKERKVLQNEEAAGVSEKTDLSGVEKDKERRREWEAERRLLREKSIERTRAESRDRSDSGAVTSGDEGSNARGRGFGGLMRSSSLTRLREDKDGNAKEREKRQRNVLRRKPSTTLVSPSGGKSGKISPVPPRDDLTPLPHQRHHTTYTAYAPPMLPLSPTPPRSPHSIHSPQAMQSTSGAPTLQPPSGILSSRDLSPSPSSGQRTKLNDLPKDKGHSPSDASGGNSGEVMTPAKEIMMRYKQQQTAETVLQEKMEVKERQAEERNREEREKVKEAELRQNNITHASSAPTSQEFTVVTIQSNVQTSVETLPLEMNITDAKRDEESVAMPYYTVYGSSSDRVMAIGKSQDSFHGPGVISETTRQRTVSPLTSPAHLPTPSSALNAAPVRSPMKSPGPVLPEISWDSREGLDLSLSFGNDSPGSGIHGGMGLDGPPEGSLQLNEVWERKVSITTKDEDKVPKPTRTSSFVLGPKTLTRKMSARWGKKSGLDSFGSVTRDSTDTGTVESIPVYVGAYGGIAEVQEAPARASLQERRASTGLGLNKRKASMSGLANIARGDDVTRTGRNLRLSIDNHVKTADVAAKHPKDVSQAGLLDAASHKVPAHSPSITPTSALPTPPHSALHSHSGLRETSPVNATVSAPAPASKGKLWKLMKRLSTGGLRDKYYYGPESSSSSSPSPASPFFSQSPNEVPPPVPALPKDIPGYKANYGPARSSLSTIATASGSPVASGRQSRASSAHTNTSASSSKNPVPTAPGGIRMPPPLPPLSSMTRPGTGGTRSSSPISSDKGSSKFFNKTQSRRSSSSSYGEELPPPRLPTSNANSSSGSLGTSGSGGSSAAKSSLLQQHIIPPSELYKLQLSLETENASTFSAGPSSSAAHTPKNSLGGKSKRGDDYMIVCSPAEERPAFSLPVPPDWRGARNRERDVEDSMMRRPPLSEDGRPPSPIIPVFSTEGAINTWNKPKKKSESGRSQGSSRPTDAAMGEVFPNGRRSMSNPRTQVSTSPSSPTPPLPLRTSRRPSTANSGLSSNGSSRITSPARSPRIYPEKVQNHEDISTPILPRIPSSPSHPTRKSIGVIPPSPSRSEVTMGSTQSLTRVPSTPVSRVVSPSASTPRSTSTSTAPWDSPSLLYSPDSSSVLSDSPAPSKRSWGLPRGWKTSLSEREKAEKWDDLLQRSERAGGTLHIGSGSGLLSDQYPNEEG